MPLSPSDIFDSSTKKHILFAPLDWGLGHATRCVPLIKRALQAGHKVTIAADKRPLALLKSSFPEVNFIRFKGYEISYPASRNMVVSMAMQLPKILFRIAQENTEIARIVEEFKVDVVIADNRYGLFTGNAKTIFITHQINIPTGIFQGIVNTCNRWFINRFDACWILDFEGEPNLSGKLSHETKLPINAVYIEPLSRFSAIAAPSEYHEYDVLAILSGPEPQRTLLEKIILAEMEVSLLKSALVRGLPGGAETPLKSDKARVFDHLKDDELQSIIQSSAVIVSRSGYSTVMDLFALKKKVIFIPTPGQREQEYLAQKFSEDLVAPFCRQEEFKLEKLLRELERFKGF